MTDTLISTRDAAALWGCQPRGFAQRMAQWGFHAVVRRGTARQGGTSYWWAPADVMKARSLAAKATAQKAAERAAKAAIPTDEETRRKRERLSILRRHYAQERWRKYWTAKAEARQAAKQAAKGAR